MLRCALSVALLALIANGQLYQGWNNLFTPPFTGNPQVVSDISCLDASTCYASGLFPGQSYSIFSFNGQANGMFTLMNMTGGESLSILSLAVGGSSAANASGFAAGGDLLGGAKYLSKNIWNAAFELGSSTVDVRADAATGLRIAFANNMAVPNGNHLKLSSDGGITFTTHVINSKLPTPNCSISRYTAMPSATTIYQTFGSVPSTSYEQSRKGRALVKRMNRFVTYELNGDDVGAQRVLRQVGEVGDSSSSSGSNNDLTCNANAAVAVTTDGGKTWNTIFADVSGFYPNEIDCASNTVCAFVADGSAGSSIFLTTDGKSFTKVFSSPDATWALQTIRFVPGNASQIFAAGLIMSSTGSSGLILQSADGGKTWTKAPTVPYVTEIVRLTFLADGTGFAVAGTLFNVATVLRYSATGPAPPAPTPAPVYSGNVSETVCEDSACFYGCVNITFPQKVCQAAPTSSGLGSFIATCDLSANVLKQEMFAWSVVCQGPSTIQYTPLETCVLNSTGASFTAYCGTP